MSDRNLEQRINIKFCVKIGKSASETLAPLTVGYGEHAIKKYSGISGSKRGEKMCTMTPEVGSQKRNGQMEMWTERTSVRSDRRSSVRLIAEELNMKRETARKILTGFGNAKNCRKDGA